MTGKLSQGLDRTFTPICPNCGAEGQCQRKVRGKTRCLDCGEMYDAE